MQSGGSPHTSMSHSIEAQPLRPPPEIAAGDPEAKDVSPCSFLSAETLTLGYWDTTDKDVDMSADDWQDTLKHNPPREVENAYTEFLLSQKDGKCHCMWVTFCGRWEHWICNIHKVDKAHQ